MTLIQVKDVTLTDEKRYSGWAYVSNGETIPHGCGKKFYDSYYVHGNFRHGVVSGPAIESHNSFMRTTQYKNGNSNGWGLCINRGQLSNFGYYENGELKVDLSDFTLWYFCKMQKSCRNENMLTIYTFKDSHEVAELLIGYKPIPPKHRVGLAGMGFHFMADGSVWMGNTPSRQFSGNLIHFCADGTIDCGRFENGKLIKRLELQEIIDAYYGTFAPEEDDFIYNSFASLERKQIREQFRYAQSITPGFNYFRHLLSTPSGDNNTNRFSMDYTIWEVDYGGRGNFVSLGESENREVWKIGDSFIVTPHGTLKIENAIFVEEGPLVGVQFFVSGSLQMNNFKCSTGEEDNIEISAFALMRQPQNAWLWGYTFDEYGAPLANFCGTDSIDGLANFMPFIKRKFQN